jgi:hypothetical protein
MKEFLTLQFRQEAARGMAVTLFILICVQNLGSSIMTALAGTNWAAADGQTKFLIATSIATNFAGALIAFFRQKLTALVTGGNLLSDSESPKP